MLRRRVTLLLFLILSAGVHAAQPTWFGYGGNAQHTAHSGVAAQPITDIIWQTPVDLDPDYAGGPGGDLFIHYASPMITAANTIVVPVKTGLVGGFKVNAFNAASGSLKWSLPTDFALPPTPNGVWTPSFPATLTPQNRLYFAGSGATVYYVDNPDAPNATITGQFAFYGFSTYAANKNFCDANYFICSPLTSDSAGNIYFSFISTDSSQNVASGIARLAPDGTGISISAPAAANNDSTILKPVYNCAPALSNDESHLYVLVSTDTSLSASGKLVMLKTSDLSYVNCVALVDPESGLPSFLPDHGTASPVIGPDDDVYVGVLENPFPENNDRGWLLHFSSDLQTSKTPGAFGWDDTPSIVPASMVPSYNGTSAYLLASKYNNYAGIGSGPHPGDGQNKLAILDPHATETDPVTGVTTMNEVLTILGVTIEGSGFREWCINSAVVDPGTGSIYAGSEDGVLYQWDLSTNTFSRKVTLTPGIGEAYTPTLIGPDGTVYAINNATLFAVSKAVPPVITSAPPTATATVGTSYVYQCTATGVALPTFSITSGALPDGLTLDVSGTISGTPAKAGAFSGTLTATNLASTADQPFTIVVSPAITTLPDGKVGAAYAQQLPTLSGLPAGLYTCVLAGGSSLPPGVQLTSAGTFSGSATASGTFNFTIKATDATLPANGGPFTFNVPVSVTFAAPALTLAPAILDIANVNTAYAQQLSLLGGTAPYTFSVSAASLPPGMNLSPAGLLSGVPTSEGDYSVAISATDSTTGGGPYSITATYVLRVDFVPFFVSPPTASNVLTPQLTTAVLAAKLDARFSASVNPPDVVLAWDFGDGSAPASGSPVTHRYLAAGNYTVAVTATNPRTGSATTATLDVLVTDSAGLPGTENLTLLRGKLNLSAHQNKIDLQAALKLSPGEAIAGATVTVNVNAITHAFTFDSKGRARTSGASAHLASKHSRVTVPAQTALLTLSISGSDVPSGLTTGVASDPKGNAATVAVAVKFNGQVLTYVAPLTWKKRGAAITAQLGRK